MQVIHGRNINEAYPLALMHMRNGLRNGGPIIERASRNGPVYEFREPVTTVYAHPEECVLFDPLRDANPFFHLFEFLWIIAGRSDVAFLKHFVKRMGDYSDDGIGFYGSYGRRLARTLEQSINRLRDSPDDRRAVAPIYWPDDSQYNGRDMPCNIAVMFKVREGKLTTTVANRSNDLIYGAYGANAVQFGLLTMYAALASGHEIGAYRQVSDSLHLYSSDAKSLACLNSTPPYNDPYEFGLVKPVHFFSCGNQVAHDRWIDDLSAFFEFWDTNGPGPMTSVTGEQNLAMMLSPTSLKFGTSWWQSIAVPLWDAHCCYRAGETEMALNALSLFAPAPEVDWLVAARQWLTRRLQTQQKAHSNAA